MRGISDLLDSDMEEAANTIDENSILSSASDATDAPPPKQKADPVKKPRKRKPVTMAKPKSRVTKASPDPSTKKAAKKVTGAKRQALEEQINGQSIDTDRNDDTIDDGEKEVKAKFVTKAKSKKVPKPVVQEDEEDEMEVDQTPMMACSGHAPAKSTNDAPKVTVKTAAIVKSKPIKAVAILETSPELADVESEAHVQKVANKERQTVKPRTQSINRHDTTVRRRAGSASDTERGDPNLRRKLGDITLKFENVDLKYRNLKEVGINEANANMEKLRKQCEATAQASNELIASLRQELVMQAPLAHDARKLKKEMQAKDTESGQLRTKVTELTTSLTGAQNEVKTLQAKLAAARSASVESTGTKTPRGALKSNGSARIAMGTNSDAAQAAQVAQMKEDLYSDLTGLIVRSVKRTDEGDTYDCIQTGRNGTLHFKLYVDQEEAKTTSFEETEFLYTPRLDANRDRELMELMPEYLTEDITFARQNAAKFYNRVVDTLTKRRAGE